MSFTLKGPQIWLEDRMVGWITTTMDGKKVFVSPRQRRKHYFRKHGGFGLSEGVLEFLRRNLFDEVHLRIGKRETLISKLSYWSIYGIKYRAREYEPQVILPEKHMTKKLLSLSEVME